MSRLIEGISRYLFEMTMLLECMCLQAFTVDIDFNICNPLWESGQLIAFKVGWKIYNRPNFNI